MSSNLLIKVVINYCNEIAHPRSLNHVTVNTNDSELILYSVNRKEGTSFRPLLQRTVCQTIHSGFVLQVSRLKA